MGDRLNRRTLARATHGVAVAMTVWLAALLPHRAKAADPEVIRCTSVAQALAEMSVLPDGSREARLSLGIMSITARDRIPGILCARECLLTLRREDGKLEKHRFSGFKVLLRTFRMTAVKGQPRLRRVRYFRLRENEWVSVGVTERRQRDGRIFYEDMRTSVYLDPPDEYKEIVRGDQEWVDLKQNVHACLDRL